MKYFKIFFAIVVISCATLLFYEYLVRQPKETNSIDKSKSSEDSNALKFQKFVSKADNTFKVADNNEIPFDDLINKHCKVEIIKNVSRWCLRMLQKYDLNKLIVETESKSSDENDNKINYHTYWQPDTVKPHHKYVMNLNVLSFLATQNRKRTKYTVWTTQSLNVFSELMVTYDKYVKQGVLEFRVLDLKQLCSVGAFLSDQKKCEQTGGGGNIIMYSDFVRFLVLNTYGGIYIDGDVIFLRDMKPFWYRNFVYRWSFTDWYNTAIMGFRKNHGVHVEKLYKTIIGQHGSLVSGFYPLHVKDVVAGLSNGNIYHYEDLEVFSSVLFDPAWLCFVSRFFLIHFSCYIN